MSECSEVLGIAPDASLQEIKRAYARALKANRPDDDAEAFGRVHAAYEDCLARFKRRQAGLSEEPDWSDDDDEFEIRLDGSEVVASMTPIGTPVEAATAPEIEPPYDPAHAAMDTEEAIFEAARTMRAQDFYAWLRADERLYDLDFKRQVGDRVIERMSAYEDSLRWQSLAALFEFFEVDSIADPRLRRDYLARQLWLRVEADARFAHGLRRKRHPDADFADRLVFAELLDPPDRKRHMKMHLIPLLSGQLRNRFKELKTEDPERAEAAISEQARDYWLPMTDPARLHPRRLALALFHSALVALPFALLLSAPEFRWRGMLQVEGVIAGIIFTIWLAGALFSFAIVRYSAWRLRTVGAGEAPAGSNILADKVTAIAGSTAVLSLGLSIVALRGDKATMGIILQVWLTMAMAMAMFRVPRFRWEALLATMAIAGVVYPYLRLLGRAKLENSYYGVGPGSFAIGVLVVLLVDAVHGRLTRNALADIRDAISVPQCILAVAALLAWLM